MSLKHYAYPNRISHYFLRIYKLDEKEIVQVPGFEPERLAWKAKILAKLDHTCNHCDWHWLNVVQDKSFLFNKFNKKGGGLGGQDP